MKLGRRVFAVMVVAAAVCVFVMPPAAIAEDAAASMAAPSPRVSKDVYAKRTPAENKEPISASEEAAGPESSTEPVKAPPAPKASVKPLKPVTSTQGPLRQFRNSKGVPLLTNRPEKYAKKKDYVEVALRYEPIHVRAQYQRRSAAEYSSGTISEIISEYARKYTVPEKLIYAVIRAESNFNPYAVSRSGARGLMQLMPGTASDMGVTDIFDPAQNIAGGTQYLAKMLGLFDNNIELALAAYNAGPTTVKNCGGIPPYPETQQYVKTVRTHLAAYGGAKIPLKYSVAGKKPKADALPNAPNPGEYVIHFQNGLTQPADKMIDLGSSFYVLYGGSSSLVYKKDISDVTKVDEAA